MRDRCRGKYDSKAAFFDINGTIARLLWKEIKIWTFEKNKVNISMRIEKRREITGNGTVIRGKSKKKRR